MDPGDKQLLSRLDKASFDNRLLQSRLDKARLEADLLRAENHVLRQLLGAQDIEFHNPARTAWRVCRFLKITVTASNNGAPRVPTNEGFLPADRFLVRLLEVLKM